MSKSKEFSITVATVNSWHLEHFRREILGIFDGFTVNAGFGAYTFNNGEVITETNATFTIGTSKGNDDLSIIVTELAKFYCLIASQESIYYKDVDGYTWLIFANGTRTSL